MASLPFDLKNVKTKQDFKSFCNFFQLEECAKVQHENGVALIADGSFREKHYTVYALGRDEDRLVIGRAITWKPDIWPNTNQEDRVGHAVNLANEFLAAWPEYKNIAHDYRKHMDA